MPIVLAIAIAFYALAIKRRAIDRVATRSIDVYDGRD